MKPLPTNDKEETQAFEFIALLAEMRDHILSQIDVRLLLLFIQAIPECEQMALSNLRVRTHLIVKGLPHWDQFIVNEAQGMHVMQKIDKLLALCGPMLESFRFKTKKWQRNHVAASTEKRSGAFLGGEFSQANQFNQL